MVYGVQKFHAYLYGRPFTLLTDHKPLTTILAPSKRVQPLAAACLQRWALLLSSYAYSIVFRPTKAHANADGLSRLPVPPSINEPYLPDPKLFNIQQIETLPLTAAQLKTATARDPELSKVLIYATTGWPREVPPELLPYWNRREELSVEDGCIMWGIQVIIPRKFQTPILQEIHHTHMGIVRMKMIARSYVWWPRIDSDIEQMVKSCIPCQQNRNAPPVAQMHPWIWPMKPWQRVHVDFAGPIGGKSYLILVDAHSKWPEVIGMKSTTAGATIKVLRRIFATHGLPNQLVSDNGPQFCSAEVAYFLKANGIKHIRCAPYHPSSNGCGEQFVQMFKRALRAADDRGLTAEQRLMGFLLTYRSSPHSRTGVPPCELFLNQHVHTCMDLLHPELSDKVATKQADQKQQHDLKAKP